MGWFPWRQGHPAPRLLVSLCSDRSRYDVRRDVLRGAECPLDRRQLLACLLIASPYTRRKERCLENLAGGDVVLSQEEKEEIARVLEEHPVKGGRYFGHEVNWLWG